MAKTIIGGIDENSDAASRKTILSDMEQTMRGYETVKPDFYSTPVPYENLLWDNRYHLIKRLGNGATAQVWKALDTKADNIEVAVKIFSALDMAGEQGKQLFVKEFTGVHKLSHPNLLTPSSYDICHDVVPYLISKYCEKGSALTLIGKMTEREILKFLKCTAEGLNCLHKHNIVHQDIKPDNVLIDDENNYVLTDFGITGQADKEIKGGTPAYMAPDFFNGQRRIATPETDIWALGVSIFELITGDVPFGEDGGKAQSKGVKVPVLPKVFKNKTIRRIVYRCLDFNPKNRPSAEDILQELSDMNNRKKQLWLIPTVAAGVAVVVVCVYYLFFYKAPNLLLAERKLSKYKQLIEDCRTLSADTLNSSRTENLLNAKLKLKEIKDLEEKFSKFFPDDYNKYSEFEDLNMVFKRESLRNAQRAERQKDRALVKPFLQISNDFYPTDGFTKAIELIENNLSSDEEIKNAIKQGINELR
jgi:serine/threonine protein kinase